MQNRAEKDHIEHEPEKIGALLVNEGFIRSSDVARAVSIQQEESQLARLPLGKLLVKKGGISKEQLQTLLSHPELREAVGAFAVEKGMIDPHRLAACIRRKPSHQPLAEALITEGFMTDEDFKTFLERQMDSRMLCDLAVKLGMISRAALTRTIRENRYRRTLGEILCDLHLITPLDLNSVLTKHRKHLKLGEILLRQGVIDRPTLDSALAECQTCADPLGTILARNNLLSEDQVYRALAVQFNIPYRKPEECGFCSTQKEALAKIIDPAASRRLGIVPLTLENNTLTVAVSDPENLKAVQTLRSRQVNFRTECILVTESTAELLFQNLYTEDSPSPLVRNMAGLPEIPCPEPEWQNRPAPAPGAAAPAAFEPPAAEASVPDEHFVHLLLRHALETGAQAIHLNRSLDHAVLQFRLGKGALPFPAPFESRIQSRITQVFDTVKKMAGIDVAYENRPQDGVLRVPLNDRREGPVVHAAFSVTACPTLTGEALTIKPIPPALPAPENRPASLGEQALGSLKGVLKDPTGMVLVAAVPGNTRSAALQDILRLTLRPDVRVVSVEDPITFSFPEVIQTQVNPSVGLTFPVLLRSALRLEPDVIICHDLPDRESAAFGFEAARKGLLFVGALNAADAARALSELRTREFPPSPNYLKAVLAHRAVGEICPDCRRPYLPGPDEWKPLFDRYPGHLTFHKGAGCPNCGFTGYRGEVLLSELMVVTDAIAKAVKRKDSEQDIRFLAIRSGMKTLIDDGLSKLDRTTLSAILETVPPEAVEVFRCIRADSRNPARPEEGALDSEPVGTSLMVTAPENQKEAIDRLHAAYEVLLEQTGKKRPRPDAEVFEAFIRSHHQAICSRYGCCRVSFSVVRKSGKVMLLATPEIDPAPASPS